MKSPLSWLVSLLCLLGVSCQHAGTPSALSRTVRILTNQVGYDSAGFKQAVVSAEGKPGITAFRLVALGSGKTVLTGKPVFAGPVDQWKSWNFWTINFTRCQTPGVYVLETDVDDSVARSHPFRIGRNVLERYTLSDVIYYFKGQRCSGLFEQADSRLPVPGGHGTVDLRGGWYDATGDYGIHFSQLDYTTYFNTQQVPLVVWSLLKTYGRLADRKDPNFQQYERRLMDEAMFGADFLVRMHVPGHSFYSTISAPGAGKLAADRRIAVNGEHHKFSLTQSPDHKAGETDLDAQPRMVSFRSGGGMAIAALALAGMQEVRGDFSQTDYLGAAKDAFAYLQKNNRLMTNDGRDNIVDDYCALLAATALYRATGTPAYLEAATRRADSLMDRLTSSGKYRDYWRADAGDRPFFSASDAGLPVVSLLTFYQIAPRQLQTRILDVVRKSMAHELALTAGVINPFGYARQLVEDTTGKRYTAFFFPHNTETAPWWQGENARLGSLAAAARLAAPYYQAAGDSFSIRLDAYASQQLNWILGQNPYDACMLDGKGFNNPNYDFFGSYQYTVAPGGIVNGITGGLDNPRGIDFNVPYSVTGKDNDWRWVEQWLPHTAWYVYAVALHRP